MKPTVPVTGPNSLCRLACSMSEAAQMLGVARSTVYKWMDEGRLETVRVGGRRLVKIEVINRLIDAPT